MIENKSNINLFFSTPVWKSQLSEFKELNKKLYNYITNLKKIDPKGLKKSTIGGWHSPNFDLNNDEPRLFVNAINPGLSEAFKDMGWDVKNQQIKITGMWSVINKTGAANARHIHPNSFLSAAYYVKAPDNCGDIMFHDPRSAAVYRRPKVSNDNLLNTSEISITPKDGLLVLFPSFLNHSVKPNDSGKERVVVSFNIDLIQS